MATGGASARAGRPATKARCPGRALLPSCGKPMAKRRAPLGTGERPVPMRRVIPGQGREGASRSCWHAPLHRDHPRPARPKAFRRKARQDARPKPCRTPLRRAKPASVFSSLCYRFASPFPGDAHPQVSFSHRFCIVLAASRPSFWRRVARPRHPPRPGRTSVACQRGSLYTMSNA